MELPDPLAGYEDWLAFMQVSDRFVGDVPGSVDLAGVLGIPAVAPTAVKTGQTLEHDGVAITRLTWSAGYGPNTGAWLLRPSGSEGDALPGVLALHCHGGYKWIGAEQLVDLGSTGPPEVSALQADWYGGRAPANELARRGYAVLAHDTFSWGTRRFPLNEKTPRLEGPLAALEALWREEGFAPTEAQRYNAAAGIHEDTVAKAAGVLGTSYTGMILHDDLVALDVLAALPGVDVDRLGSFGFSGGGGRALLLSALDSRMRATVVSCMMATFGSLIPLYLDTHSWLLNSPGLWQYSDWPEMVRGRATLVQYGETDALFPPAGMHEADDLLRTRAGYRGTFYPSGHVFDVPMQAEAFDFLDDELVRR